MSLAPHVAGWVTMLVAGPATLLGVMALNRGAQAPERDPGPREVAFSVDPPKPKPKKKRRAKRKRQARPRPARAAAPPPPNLATNLSGVDLGLGSLSAGGLETVSDRVLGNMDEVVHTEDTVDDKPVPTVTTPIDVPAHARAKNLSGRVVLSLLIGKDGRVRQAKVTQSEPPGVFDEAALRAVRGWEFKPAAYRGKPVEVWASLPIRFQP